MALRVSCAATRAALLTPRIAPLASAHDTRRARRSADDRAPDWVAAGTPEPLRGELIALLGAERVLARAIDLIRYASDASPYRRSPAVVVMPHDAADVGKVLALRAPAAERPSTSAPAARASTGRRRPTAS